MHTTTQKIKMPDNAIDRGETTSASTRQKPKGDLLYGKLPKLLYTIKETAYILGIKEKSVRRLLERGLLKSNPALRIKLITRESIEAFVKMTT